MIVLSYAAASSPATASFMSRPLRKIRGEVGTGQFIAKNANIAKIANIVRNRDRPRARASPDAVTDGVADVQSSIEVRRGRPIEPSPVLAILAMLAMPTEGR